VSRYERAKGHSFERRIARLLTEKTGYRFRRGLQTRGGSAEIPDVACEGLPYHFECKKGKKPPWRGALIQAEEAAADGDIPVAVIGEDRQEPVVAMRISAFLDLLQDSLNWRQHRGTSFTSSRPGCARESRDPDSSPSSSPPAPQE